MFKCGLTRLTFEPCLATSGVWFGFDLEFGLVLIWGLVLASTWGLVWLQPIA